MTILYRTVPITSAEQADALPVGTIAKDADLSVAVKAEDGHWARTDVADGLPMMTGGSMVGWTALVPMEAEVVHAEPKGVGFATERLAGGPFTAYYVHEREA